MAVLGLVAAGLAGCTSPSPAAAADGLRLGASSGLPTAPRTTATLDAPPQWRLGEWWHVAWRAPLYHVDADVDAVVAGVDNGSYELGMAGHLDDGLLLLHFPGFGEVDRQTLGFDAHDRPIVPLRFPLTLGKTWQTQWYTGVPENATVDAVDLAAGTAHVRFTGTRTFALTYDAKAGFVTQLDIDGYGGYKVTKHGYGFHGKVVVPSRQDLVFCNGRQGTVQAVDFCVTKSALDPQAPTQAVQVKPGYDRVSFGLFLRDTATAPAPVGPGALDIRVTAPDGSAYEATKDPTTTGMVMYPHGLDHPAGAWQVTSVTVGDELAILEGVAYRVLQVDL